MLIFFIFSFSFLLHFIPNLGIPLHSDVTWFFRLQTTQDSEVIQAIPEGMKEFGAYPSGITDLCVRWFELSQRVNCADLAALRLTAIAADGNADIWRLMYILNLAGAVFFFCLILKRFKVAAPIIYFLALGLILSPVGMWTDYKSAEPRAVLFLMLAYWLTLVTKSKLANFLSALAMLAVVLTKETFIGAWVLIPGLIIWNEGHLKISRAFSRMKNWIIYLWPHILAGIILMIYLVILRLMVPIEGNGNIFVPNALKFIEFAVYGIYNLLPALTQNYYILLVILGLGFGFLISNPKKELQKIFLTYFNSKRKILIFLTISGIFLTTFPYFLTGRELFDRYLLPGNFLMALLVGVLVTPLYNYFSSKIKGFWLSFLRIGFLVGILIFLAFEINGILDHSKQDRIDQNAWQSLIGEVSMKAPHGSHIVLKFDEAGMVETAWSLEANTLFLRRYDLTYHLEIEDKDSVAKAGDFLKKNIELFNLERPAIEDANNVLYVRADRRGGENFQPYLNWQILLED